MNFCLEPKPEAEAEKEAGEEGSIEDFEAPYEDFLRASRSMRRRRRRRRRARRAAVGIPGARRERIASATSLARSSS
eukprot:10970878-Alexandrium_andersonii.AAC.1